MKKTLPYFILTTLFILVCQVVWAQPPQKRSGGAPQITFSGQVVDAETQLPLEYATVTLYAKRDSSILTGGVTGVDGSFLIKSRPAPAYVVIEFIGYEPHYINDVEIDKTTKTAALGTILLGADATTLEQVEVRAERSEMQFKLDKKVFNVGKDLANRGGTAEDILDNVPSVSVGVEGDVSLRGSQNVKILINGKPSGLVSSGDAKDLRQLPANLIQSVEVITNPSAKFEASGTSGIINIVLRKEEKKGINGSFDVSVGWPASVGTAINLNYRKNKVNLFTNIGISYKEFPGGGKLLQEQTKNDSLFILDQRRDHVRGGVTGRFRFGADYYIDKKNTLTGALLYKKGKDTNTANLTYADFLHNLDNQTRYSTRDEEEIELEDELEYSLNYKHDFGQKGHQLKGLLQYNHSLEEEGSDFIQQYFTPDLVLIGEPVQERSDNEEGEKKWDLQFDYTYPFSEDGKFETGYAGSLRTIENDFKAKRFVDDEWTVINNFSNEFFYEENIHALYATYGNKHGKLSYQAGLRMEASDVTTELKETNEINPRKYTDFFPSGHVSWTFSPKSAVQMSYSRRIYRPHFYHLNPFFTYSDPRDVFAGNPNLNPEYIHSMEVSHLSYWEKGSLSAGVYYRITEGVIERIREFDELGNSYTLPQNLSEEDAVGIELNGAYSPTKWWKLNGEFNFYYFTKDGGNLGEEFKADGQTWNVRLTSKKTVAKVFDVQIRANYRAPENSVQGKRKSMFFMNFGASKEIFKKKGTITLSVSDVFNTRKRRYIYEGANFYTEGDFRWRARTMTLSLNYRLNQPKRRGHGGGRPTH